MPDGAGPKFASAQSPPSAAQQEGDARVPEDAEVPEGEEVPAPILAATIDGTAVHAADVQRQLERSLRGRAVEESARPSLQARALGYLVERALVLQYLDKYKLGATPDEIELAIARLEKQLQGRGMSLEEYLARQELTRDKLREALAWQIGWPRYLDRYLTEENLRNFFERHRAQFDGRRVRVAHILLRVAPRVAAGQGGDEATGSGGSAEETALSEALERARRLREEILGGKLAFADAARRDSESPSGRDGGELGWIERHQPMPEPFSAAAFALKVDEVSPPVVSPLGVHLIRCQEIQPGEKSWRDVEPDLRAAVTRYLFDWTAARQRPHTTIRFTGAVPYRDPRSGALVSDGSPATLP